MSDSSIRAYHGDPQLKADLLRLLAWHREQDKILQGTYQDISRRHTGQQHTVNGWTFKSFGRGCAVGCSIESLRIITGRADLSYSNHAAYEELIGVPQVLARLEDGIFERLPIDEARDWPIQFAEAIPVGADLSLIWPRFAVWLLGDPQDGVIQFAKTDRRRAAIQAVVDAYLRLLGGQAPTEEEWRSYAYAAAAAADAAAADAYAAYAAAAYAAAAAADAYAAADDAYAYAAADDAYAAAAAHTQARQRQAAKLLELLRSAA